MYIQSTKSQIIKSLYRKYEVEILFAVLWGMLVGVVLLRITS